MGQILEAFSRRKHVDNSVESQLARVLTVVDLTALGVGATLGAGVYVLTGAVAKTTSGPSVVIAFLIAALTSILSGLCYAEFGARVPKAGSGYIYSYVTVGEMCAFVIGWNLILSYVIGAASVARAWTANFDALIDKKMESAMLSCCAMDVPGLAKYPDLFSFLIIMVLTALIAFGVKEFATVNKIFTVLNICVIIFVTIAGLSVADLHNWSWTTDEIYTCVTNMELYGADAYTCLSENVSTLAVNGVSNVTDLMTTTSEGLGNFSAATTGATGIEIDMSVYGEGGFFPFGFAGLISGTATCFYAFVGFDCIATTGEEAINPQKAIPLGIVFSLAVCCIAYLGISSTLTLMQPYFLLDTDAPLPYAFKAVGMQWAKWPVSIGAILALSTSLLGAMFPMPRIIYAMAIDGLLFKFLAAVHEKTKTPLVATFISGTFAGIMAIFFDLKELVDLMSIGTLAAYTLVAASVLLLRYQPDPEADLAPRASDDDVTDDKTAIENHTSRHQKFTFSQLFRPESSRPTKLTNKIVNWSLAVSTLAMICLSIIAILSQSGWNAGALVFLFIFLIVVILTTLVIFFQPQSTKELEFKVPLVPTVPIVNMLVNVYLMVSLPPSTWYKLLVWLVAGGLIYGFYGIQHSVEGPAGDRMRQEQLERKNSSSPTKTNREDQDQLLHETQQV